MRLGSLFDGSGTAPLAAAMCGIDPVWASEIEPFPIRVTSKRFPAMKHLGSITEINGADVVPVDIICGGSPCQDLSVAGKQAGLHEGKRSHLFFEMTRIISEMRGATNGKYPRYVVWENVPGAFSSNSGRDFLAVLQAFAEIADPAVHVPEPEIRGGRLAWKNAGEMVGDGWSIAWRTLDAQYWGVPQRRRRIYLVAGLGSERAGEILFERTGVSGNSEPGREARKETAADAGRSTEGGSGVKCLNPWDSQTIRQYDADGVYPALTSNATGGQNRQGICVSAGFVGRQGAKSGSVASVDCRNMVLNDELSGTLQAKENGGHSLNYQNPVVYEPRSMLAENWAESDAKNALRAGESKSAHAVVYSSGSFGTLSEGVGCLGTGTRATAEMVAVFDTRDNGSGELAPTLTGDHQNRVTDYTALCVGNGQLHQISMAEQANCLDCMHDQQAVIYPGVGITSKQNASNPRPGDPAPTISTDSRNYLVKAAKPPRRYIVRRLVPLECCRLQGFPDWWTEGCEAHPLTGWWAQNTGWLKWIDPHGAVTGSDSAQYKLWGNGMALPNMLFVIRNIASTEVLT